MLCNTVYSTSEDCEDSKAKGQNTIPL